MIKGETLSTYTVGAADIGCSLYCIITDKSNKTFSSKVTSKVASVKITELKITGQSGFDSKTAKTPTIPVVDDELNAVVDPESAGNLVDYQWYRGGSKITGATNKTYKLTGDDIGSIISVKIDPIDKTTVNIANDAVEAKTSKKVVNKIGNLTMSLSKTTDIQVNDVIAATVKDGSANITESNKVTYQWYRDSVSDSTKIVGGITNQHTVVSADNGHKLILVVSGDKTNYYGDFELSTGMATQNVPTPNIVNDSGSPSTFSSLGVGTKLIAKFADADKDATATYQWYKNNSPISGATSAEYELTTADKSTNPVEYKVIVKGTGSYIGQSQDTQVVTAVTENLTIDKFVVLDEDGKEVTTTSKVYVGKTYTATTKPIKATDSVVYTWFYRTSDGVQSKQGATFTVPQDITIKSNDAHYEIMVTALYVGDKNDKILPGAESLLTNDATKTIRCNSTGEPLAPTMENTISKRDANEEGNDVFYYINQAATASTTITDNTNVFLFKTKKALTSATIKYDNNAYGNKNATDYKPYDVAEVGVYAHVAVEPNVSCTYQWYVDKVNDEYKVVETADPSHPTQVANGIDVDTNGGAKTANLRITDTLIGHTLICVVTGTDSYAGSIIKTTASSAVKPSSKTIDKIKIVDTSVNASVGTKDEFNNATQVTAMTVGGNYKVYALDSEGKVADTAYIKEQWDGSKVSDYIKEDSATWTAEAGKGIITVTVSPDGKNYTGEPVSYTFKTEISDSSSNVVKTKVTTNDELKAAIDGCGADETIEIAAAGLSTDKANIYSNLLIDSGCSLTLTSATAVTTKAIENKGTLNLRAGADASEIGGLTNKGTVNIDTDHSYILKANSSNEVGKNINVNAGTLVVENGKTLTNNGTIANAGTLKNGGTITTTGALSGGTCINEGNTGVWNLNSTDATNALATFKKVASSTFSAATTVNVNPASATTITLDSNVSTVANTTLVVGEHATLAVPVEKTLTIVTSSSLKNDGTITNAGTLTTNSNIVNTGVGTWNLESETPATNATLLGTLGGVSWDGSAIRTVNVNESATTSSALTIHAKEHVNIKSGKTLTLGADLTLNGKLSNNGVFAMGTSNNVTMGNGAEFASVKTSGAITGTTSYFLASTTSGNTAKFTDISNTASSVITIDSGSNNTSAVETANIGTNYTRKTGGKNITITTDGSNVKIAIEQD